MLLAPFHGISVDEYARTLWYHVLWHVQLGVTRYLLYVFERLGALLAHPLIQVSAPRVCFSHTGCSVYTARRHPV